MIKVFGSLPGHHQGVELEVKNPGPEPGPIWDASVTSESQAHHTNMPAPGNTF